MFRLDEFVALQFDIESFRSAVGDELFGQGQDRLMDVVDVGERDGGAFGLVAEDRGRLSVWIGIVSRVVTSECDGDGCADGELCPHAVAVAIAGFGKGVRWASIGRRDHVAPEREIVRLAERLTRKQLIRLVAGQAADDRHFAARLRAAAGELTPASPAQVAEARGAVSEASQIPDSSRMWDLHDLVKAGELMVSELRLLSIQPATTAVLDLVEEAILVWDRLSEYLNDAWETYENEPGEIGSALAEIHLSVCAELRLDPDDLADRLHELDIQIEAENWLDSAAYARLL